jgi:hypothetical protein
MLSCRLSVTRSGEIITCDIERNIFFDFFGAGGPAGRFSGAVRCRPKNAAKPVVKGDY